MQMSANIRLIIMSDSLMEMTQCWPVIDLWNVQTKLIKFIFPASFPEVYLCPRYEDKFHCLCPAETEDGAGAL